MNLKPIIVWCALLLSVWSATAQTTIQSGRAVEIRILGVPSEEKSKIDGQYPVSDSGTINMPFVGTVQAAGMKPEALARAIEERFRAQEIYRNPTIHVISSDTSAIVNEMVHVGGQVRKTGPVKYNRGLTLYQAIQSAGGPTEFGNMRRVKLYRSGREKQYDLTDAQFMHLPLEPNDTIEVPQKGIIW